MSLTAEKGWGITVVFCLPFGKVIPSDPFSDSLSLNQRLFSDIPGPFAQLFVSI